MDFTSPVNGFSHSTVSFRNFDRTKKMSKLIPITPFSDDAVA